MSSVDIEYSMHDVYTQLEVNMRARIASYGTGRHAPHEWCVPSHETAAPVLPKTNNLLAHPPPQKKSIPHVQRSGYGLEQLTKRVHSSSLPFNGLYPRNPFKYMVYCTTF